MFIGTGYNIMFANNKVSKEVAFTNPKGKNKVKNPEWQIQRRKSKMDTNKKNIQLSNQLRVTTLSFMSQKIQCQESKKQQLLGRKKNLWLVEIVREDKKNDHILKCIRLFSSFSADYAQNTKPFWCR